MAQARPNLYAYGSRHQRSPYGLQKKAHYTIVSVQLLNRPVAIHRKQYHFDQLLGKGGFGEVYAARRLQDGKRVAIKVVSIATDHSGQAENLKIAFLNEVEMAKRLAKTSRHIVHMYDFDFHQTGLTFIVMELGQEDLEQALSSRPPLSSVERKGIWRQLVNIAVTLYNRQIVHLDIKPKNLVIFPGNVLKLVDLGIAQKAHHRRTGSNGTIPYSAPEVTDVSNSHVTMNSRKADVWSWGAVLYRVTYNQSPNQNYTPPCYHPPRNQYPARDPHLLDVLRHTLVINPKERPDVSWLAQHPYTSTR